MAKNLSGKVKKTPPLQVTQSRYDYIGLSETEPDLGVPSAANQVLTSTVQGVRSWSSSLALQGAQGMQGAGTVGTQGPQGIQGIGNVGIQGIQGFRGLDGYIGADGTQGTQGIQGFSIQGTTGSQGIQGRQGTDGLQGTVGQSGLNGAQGIQGVQGNQGVQGVQGVQGGQGVQGVVGVGAQGPSGMSGDLYSTSSTSTFTLQSSGNQTISIGLGLSYSAGQAITLAYDASNIQYAIVSSYNNTTGSLVFTRTGFIGSGTYASWYVNLAGAVGQAGPTGLQGIQGVDGLFAGQGVQGTQGLQGIQGFGYAQLQGTQGIQGIQGRQGTQGVQGIQGIQGIQGFSIQGAQGTQGSTGVQGIVFGSTPPANQGVLWVNTTANSSAGTQGIQGIQGGGFNQSQGIQGGLGSFPTTIPDASVGSPANSTGFMGLPQISVSANYTAVFSDFGKHIYATTNGITITIPANSSVAFPIGATLTFINASSVTTSIAINLDTLYLASYGLTGPRTLNPNGMASAIKITSTSWIINGTGLS
jgi:hypothetical protein